MAVWYLLFSFPLLSLFFRFRGVVYLFLSLHYRRLSRTVRCLMCPCATPFPTTIFDVCSQLPAQLKNRHHDCRLRGCLVLEQKYVILPTCSTVTPTVKWQKRIFCKIFWFTTQRPPQDRNTLERLKIHAVPHFKKYTTKEQYYCTDYCIFKK